MKSLNKIFLIGLPGSGKTTLGKELAKALHIPFFDLDAEIERTQVMTIPEIFKQKGEDYFRQQESSVLKEFCSSTESFVLATGGGAPCFFDNMKSINQAGTSIFLDVPAKEITRRIKSQQLGKRPLFANTPREALKDQIEFMRSSRISFYRQAHFVFSGADITVKGIVEKVKTENLG
ncbi:MAG: shikimate kinase [Cyclobacteriaceae bacterium]|nr:shikimate kinase [Cyclobacteriaceae bacterium]